MSKALFQPTVESEARLLLLIDAFSRGSALLEGRTKLAKLDFFLRYPTFMRRALEARGVLLAASVVDTPLDLEARMVRYRFGPWDPQYFAVLGRLVGKGLVVPIPFERGIGYRATDAGGRVAAALRVEPAWQAVSERIALLKRHLNLSGTTLKNLIYEMFPEIALASWGKQL